MFDTVQPVSSVRRKYVFAERKKKRRKNSCPSSCTKFQSFSCYYELNSCKHCFYNSLSCDSWKYVEFKIVYSCLTKFEYIRRCRQGINNSMIKVTDLLFLTPLDFYRQNSSNEFIFSSPFFHREFSIVPFVWSDFFSVCAWSHVSSAINCQLRSSPE